MHLTNNDLENNRDFLNKSNSGLISKFIKSVSVRNQSTGKQYQFRLSLFEKFLEIENSSINADRLIQKLKNKELDPYDILNDYCLYLKNNSNLSNSTLKDKIITTKDFSGVQ